MIIDSHCHLDYSNLYNQLDDIIKRAELNKVKCLLTICTTLKSFDKIKQIIEKHKNIYGTFGIHPHETDSNHVSKKTILDNIKISPKIIGIGETGLDFYYNNSKKSKQIDSFNIHIEAALEANLPIIVHSRNAEEETFNALNKYKEHKTYSFN